MATRFGGYMGRVVLADLTRRTAEDYPWTDADREKYIGGKIMAAKILSDHLTGAETPFFPVSSESFFASIFSVPRFLRLAAWAHSFLFSPDTFFFPRLLVFLSSGCIILFFRVFFDISSVFYLFCV